MKTAGARQPETSLVLEAFRRGWPFVCETVPTRVKREAEDSPKGKDASDRPRSAFVLTAAGFVRRLLALVPPPNTHLTSFHGVESTPRRLAAHGDAAADSDDTVTDAKDEATRASPPPRLGHAAPAHRKAPTSCAAPVAAAGAFTPSTPPGRRQKERLIQLGHRLARRHVLPPATAQPALPLAG